MQEEGIIKYQQFYSPSEAVERDLVRELLTYRLLCFEKAFIGVDQEGYGYGNISQRYSGNQFFITGTQTGHHPILNVEHLAFIEKFDIEQNSIWCSGPVKASSESLTHAGIYQANSKVNVVVHIHNGPLWQFALKSKPTTSPNIEYGTVKMSKAIMQIVEFSQNGIMAMAGHHNGLIAWGSDFPRAMEEFRKLEKEMEKSR